ncbi:MAG: hypothetical protein AAF497_03390 [Planctomycetota bacterium]
MTEPWPSISFKVFTASGRYVGYGSKDADSCDIYPSCCEDDDWFGLVRGCNVEFGSGVLAGTIDGLTLHYADGGVAGVLDGDDVYDQESNLVGTTSGDAAPGDRLGAVLLLILNRWYLPDGTPNPDVR